jgi:hypothetical protein
MAMIEECIESPEADDRGRKRCARSATTASNSVLDRSADMQAIRVEIVVNQSPQRRPRPPPDSR